MGDISLAKEMIDAAAKNGADFAKFQTWSVKRLKPGVWDDVASSVQPAAQAQNLDALARQIHQQLGLTDVVSLGFILISLQGAVEFDQKMQGMR